MYCRRSAQRTTDGPYYQGVHHPARIASLTIARVNEYIRYEPNDPCPPLLATSVALQGVVLTLANTVLFVTITARAAGQGDAYLSWAVFAALIIAGATTALQAARVGRLGAGHVLMSGAGPHFVALAILVLALPDAGLPTLASLIVVASLVQFALAAWLPLLRRIITPVVAGTALMLIAVMVMSIAIGRIGEPIEGVPPSAGPAVAVVTLAVAVMLAMRAAGVWRLWAPLIGIVSGCAVAVPFGLYDPQPVLDAPWFDLPDIAAWLGLDLTPGVEFWTFLPAFLIVSLVSAVKASGDGVVIQQVSRREPPATDFRLVQGVLNTNGLGALLSGLAGTLPTIIYSPSTVSLITFTGVAARRVGFAMGGVLAALAFLPKVAAVLLTIPSPVMGAFLLMIMGLLFVEGMRTVVQDGLDHRKALVVGISLALGVGLESRNVLADLLGETWVASLSNGMTVGVVAAVLMTLFLEASSRRHSRLEVPLSTASLPTIDTFLLDLASKIGWNTASTERLRAAGEETLSSLLQADSDYGADRVPRLIVVARPGEAMELEFLAVFDEENLQDRLAYLSEQPQVPEAAEISFRLLRHYASSVHHRKYHGVDVVTVHVDGSR
ncbi:MAG: hypothetical protein OXG33_12980 [Chloroflexi bacterium]|nr:hypothetical protein [Chloroflexota bacterium]